MTMHAPLRKTAIRTLVLAASLLGTPALARHKEAPLPPAPAPVAAPAEATPPRPMPPGAAAFNIVLPPVGADGQRVSPNRNITPAQMLWNLRSGWNVAALNCPMPQYDAVADGYRGFLKRNAKVLKATNAEVDAEFRAQYGANAGKIREAYMTQVYNHFSLPPTLTHFCDAAAAMTHDIAGVPSNDLTQFAARELPSLEAVFDDFYARYEAYTAASLAWDRRYGEWYDAMYGLQYNGPNMPATPYQGASAAPLPAMPLRETPYQSASALPYQSASAGPTLATPATTATEDRRNRAWIAAEPGVYGPPGATNADPAPSIGY